MDLANEKYLELKEKLLKLEEGDIVLVDKKKGRGEDGKDGINVAYINFTHELLPTAFRCRYSKYVEINLYFAGDSDPWSLHELLDLYPNSKFYKVQKGDEI